MLHRASIMIPIRSGRPCIGRIGDLIAMMYPYSGGEMLRTTALNSVKGKLKHQKSRFLPVREHPPTYHKWRIFGRATIGPKCHYMQQEVLLHELQANQSSDTYAVVGGYRVSVDEVEKQTGYDLLSNVPESVQRVVEAGVDR